MRGTLLRASLALGVGLLLAPSAGATPPGLHVDPDSPGGKEYAIPLDQARDDAGGGGSQSGGGPGSHLFGVGVGGSDGSGGSGSGAGADPSAGGTDTGGSGSGGDSGGSGGADKNDAGDRSGGDSDSGSSRGRLSTLNVAAANPEAGPQAPLLVLGASAGIVFAGVLLGLMLRRRRTPGASA
jgi:hypothetical protein